MALKEMEPAPNPQ